MYSFYAWCQMIVLCSFIGFLIENIWLLLTKGRVDNRNMNLPFLLGYGLAVFGVYVVISVPDISSFSSLFTAYIILFFAVSIGEVILGTAVERLCGFSYWDYTRLPFHFTKYTSLFTSMGFALLIEIFMCVFFEKIMDLIESLLSPGVSIVSVLLLVILVADFIDSFRIMHSEKALYDKWSVEVSSGQIELHVNRSARRVRA